MATLGTVQQIQANTAWNNTKPLWLVVILTILVDMVMKSMMMITLKQCKEVELCLPRWRKDGEAPTWTTEASECRSPATEFAFIFASIDSCQNYLRPQSFLKLTNHENIATSITFSRFSLSTSFSPSLNIKILLNTKYFFKSFHNNIAIGPTPSLTSSQDFKSFFAIKRIWLWKQLVIWSWF